MTHPAGDVPMIVLVGLPGAGKTTVGRLAAERLGWPFVDVDAAVVAAAGGRAIPELFASEGEMGFRQREYEATAALAGRQRVVVSTGGGWMTNLGCVELLRPPARIIHLRVGVSQALTRLAGSGEVRPLLARPDPAAALRALAARRAAAYGRADFAIDTEALSLQQVVAEVVRLASAGGAG